MQYAHTVMGAFVVELYFNLQLYYVVIVAIAAAVAAASVKVAADEGTGLWVYLVRSHHYMCLYYSCSYSLTPTTLIPLLPATKYLRTCRRARPGLETLPDGETWPRRRPRPD